MPPLHSPSATPAAPDRNAKLNALHPRFRNLGLELRNGLALLVPESRFGTEKRSRTLSARLRIADSVPAAVLRQLHQRCREGADDSGDHTAFLLCVLVFGAGPWVSAARREPLVASRLVTPLPTTAAGVRSLSSILQSLVRAVRCC